MRTLALLAAIAFGTSPAVAGLKVAVGPIRGDARYPLVLNGLRQVLLSDLGMAGSLELSEAELPSDQYGTDKIADLSKVLNADVLLLGYMTDHRPNFTLTLRAYDLASGYSLGSRDLNGTYGDIKFVQDRLAIAALELLRTPISSAQQTALSKSHTSDVGAVVAMGEADVAIQDRRYGDAIVGMAKARNMDAGFQAPRYQIERRGEALASKISDPAEIGRAYRWIGKNARSAEEFDRALKKNPADVKAMIGKAELLLQLNNPTGALELFQQAGRLDPKNIQAWAGAAQAYQTLGKKTESLAAYERARDLGATEPEVYESLGALYASRNQKSAAAGAYQTAGTLAERAVNIRKAQENYAQSNQLVASAEAMERQADMYIAAGEVDLAITILTKALFVDSKRDSLLAKLGYAYYLNRQTGEAIQRLERAYDINPNNYEANLYLGLILLDDRDQVGRAIKHIENAVRIRPDDRQTQYLLAQTYLKLKRTAEAVALLEKLSRANPRDAMTHKQLGDVYFVSEDFQRSEIEYTRATELRPDYREAYEGLARVYIRLGRREQAMAMIEKVYAIDAENNLFQKEGPALLEGLVSQDLIRLCLAFPKRVPTDLGEIPINQVGVVEVQEPPDLDSTLRKFFFPYRMKTSRLGDDLQVALLALYRVIPTHRLGPLSSGTIERSDYQLDTNLSALATTASLDGVFGYRVTGLRVDGPLAKVQVSVSMFSAPDKGRYEMRGEAPTITFTRSEVVTFNPWVLLGYGVVLIVVLGPLGYFTIYRSYVIGKGNLRVIINYDPKLESFLTLKLSTRQEKERDSGLVVVRDKQKYEKRKYKELLKQKGAWVRKMVGRVTLFERVPARTYFCYLYGTIEDGAVSKKTVGNYFMVQKATIERDVTREVVFQLEKDEAFVTVYVRKGDEDIPGAEIRMNDVGEVVYSRGAAGAFLYCKTGKHKITVKHEGRTVQHLLEVFDLNDKHVNIDLRTADEAVQASLGQADLVQTAQQFEAQGRLQDAAQLYDKAGDTGKAGEVRAEAMLSEGDSEAAAKELIRNREFWKAAELYRQLGDENKANYLYGLHAYKEGDLRGALERLKDSDNYALLAKIYEQTGEPKKAAVATAKAHLAKGQKLEAAQAFLRGEEFTRAAEIYESLDDLAKAAMLHAKDGNYAVAADLFSRIGDQRKAAMAFEKGGLFDQAATIYKELGETEKVIELLVHDQRYIQAAELYREQGLIDQAIALCQRVPSYHADFPRTQLVLGQMFGEKGLIDLALKTFSEAISSHGGDVDLESLYLYASLLEKEGETTKALEVLEGMIKRDFHFKDVGIRIKELKAKVAAAPKSGAKGNGASETIAGAAPAKESRYEILEEIGRGAMGVVYKAKDRMLDRIVAFKTLPQTLKDDPAALESLVKEAQTAARLNHPNIVTVFDVGEENGNYFMAMEFIQGKTLQEILKQVKLVSVENFRHIARTLCEVVAYAHAQRVIHRDIKPSNILLMANRTVKLMDFGLAKVLQDMSIDKTMLRGTPLYMSPEQVLGKDIDHRTDIYSLGIIFYEMLAGQPPFIQGDIMYAHLHTAPPPLVDRAKGAPPAFIEAVMSCLAKDKNQRPRSATDLSKALGFT